MKTALDYVMLSPDSSFGDCFVSDLLLLFWSCSLSPDSRVSNYKVKDEFGEAWSFRVPLQRRVTDSS